jgi:hypothetical protein
MSIQKDLLDLLITYDFPNKIRLGINGDGGYVIANLENTKYDCYISAGISNEESFSRDFINKYGMTKENSFAFDGTINDYPYNYTRNITYVKKNISNISDGKNTDLLYLLKNYKNLFLKMDIEGGEYPWLLSLDIDSLRNITQIAIEIHGIMDDTYGCVLSDKIKCFKKLAETHYIVHAHGNNWAPTVNGIPNVIELTYVNKSYFNEMPKWNADSLPILNLDYPNKSDVPDIQLNIYPFTQIKQYIPNIAHFIFGLKPQEEEFLFVYYLSVYSCVLINNPDTIYFYYHYLPYGKWWEELQWIKSIKFIKIDIPTHFGKKTIEKTAHKADKVRMDILLEKGGVYLDIDTICVKPYKYLLNNRVVLGKEIPTGICNAIMMTEKNSDFFKIWIENYEEHFNTNGWGEGSIILPYKLAEQYPNLLNLQEADLFFLPTWTEIDRIFEKPVDIPSKLITLHLWETMSMKYINEIKGWEWANTNTHTLYGKIMLELQKHSNEEILQLSKKNYYNYTFTNIYKKGIWNDNNPSIPLSGPGSSVSATVDISKGLTAFIYEKNCKSVLDLGCGDLTWIKNTDFFKDSNIDYTGVDIVEMIINNHKKEHITRNFICSNIITFSKKASLVIIRDVIFHLKIVDILELFNNIKSTFEYIAITSCNNQSNDDNLNKWHFSERNIKIYPFNISTPPLVKIDEANYNRAFYIYSHDEFYNISST